MRVISGKYRGRKLASPADDSVRPTTDRIKETIFNILQWQVEGARVLDLFAGSGALGIECLSRGAEDVVFVDRNPASVALVRQNLKGMDGNFRVVAADFMGVLRSGESKFDLVFIDPPYKSGLGELAVDAVFDLGRLAEDGTVVYEHSSELAYSPKREAVVTRTKVMGSVTVDFVRKKKVGLVTGTFDPITKGHLEVIDEALRLFDEVVVAVLVNPEKECMFTPEERLELINAALSDKTRVKTLFSEDYAVDVARSVGADKLVRGVRGKEDEAYENEMARFNREHGFDTVFVTPERYADVSSTRAREQIAKGDFRLLPDRAIMVAEELMKKRREAQRRD